jgi:alkanesulfonate monooxygenase SsuD/methylene tetrahydromethanopterin reductase-like flavin-dependent oxidoreductase (luciferase family)
VKLGIGLPGYLGTAAAPQLSLDWARGADEAGFHALAAHDRPAHDAWDPLMTLAAAAAVTTRVRLVTTVLLLPARDESVVAKQAMAIDNLSGGRLELGVGLGGREVDYEVLGGEFRGRGRRLERQLVRMDELFRAAIEHSDDGVTAGPPPIQRPRPPLRVGGYTDAALRRATTLGDGYIFGVAGIEAMRNRIPVIREAYRAAGRPELPIGGLAYIAATADRERLARGEELLTHYYGTLRKSFPEMVHTGEPAQLRETIDQYRDAGLDTLYLFPVLPDLDQLDELARLL